MRGEEGHYIILKGSIQQEDLTILNIYAPNVGAAKYINQLITKVKKYLDNNTLILGDFNLALSILWLIIDLYIWQLPHSEHIY